MALGALPSVRTEPRMEMELSVEASKETCEIIRKSLNPDNNEDIIISCKGNKIVILVRNLKIGSLYNTLEDIIRCYEVSNKIAEGEA